MSLGLVERSDLVEGVGDGTGSGSSVELLGWLVETVMGWC